MASSVSVKLLETEDAMERLLRGVYTPEFLERAVRLHEVEGLAVPEVAKWLSMP